MWARRIAVRDRWQRRRRLAAGRDPDDRDETSGGRRQQLESVIED
jgi:hypothetical protein